MNRNVAILSDLVFKYLQGTLSEQESLSLENWKKEKKENEEVFEALISDKAIEEGIIAMYEASESKIRVRERLQRMTPAIDPLVPVIRSVHRVHFLRTAWFRYTAAAMLIFLIGAAVYFRKMERPSSLLVHTSAAPAQNDVKAPVSSHAILTLAGGQQIAVDSAMNGTLAKQGNMNIQKMDDGRIVYKGKGGTGEMQYNILTVPRGSQIASMVLSDGSKVFLNAASSLKYPVAFTGNERRVEITGEAYFEVAKDPKRLFTVKGGNVTTEVLGTHFNVNTYPDEEDMKVTLLEGSVKVVSGSADVIIKPGDQAAVRSSSIQVNKSINTDQVMAWKNGFFNFNNADLQTTMRQFARWYDITVRFEGQIPEFDYQGELPKNLTLSQVLKVLNKIGVKYRIEGKTLIVSP